ncbi:transposase [Micromonospora sp. HNM0581]|nr:transposase [Micromonospora sp. HNM0581]
MAGRRRRVRGARGGGAAHAAATCRGAGHPRDPPGPAEVRPRRGHRRLAEHRRPLARQLRGSVGRAGTARAGRGHREGRGRLAAGPPASVRDQVRYVAIDMYTIFKSAIQRVLPHAQLVVNHFDLVQLANACVTEVRRRVTLQHRGRRGRKGNREWELRNRLTRSAARMRAEHVADRRERGLSEDIRKSEFQTDEVSEWAADPGPLPTRRPSSLRRYA